MTRVLLPSLTRAHLSERDGLQHPAAPIRIVHQGLGAFHRAHQAWYTSVVDSDNEWGIAAFTGRSPDAAAPLARQDGLFTLVQRAQEGDLATIVESIAEAVDGADLARYLELLAAPGTAIVTLTITEAGYRLAPAGGPDFSDPVVARDLRALGVLMAQERFSLDGALPVTALGRLVLGLEARRRAGSGPIAVVPCDNLPDNGRAVRAAVVGIAERVSESTAAWIEENVSFVSTSVDRIVPKLGDELRAEADELSGFHDESPVVSEMFSDWVLSGDFPAGRPRWEDAGARFVDEIEPFERRKLWLLNGSHSLLAYRGLLGGLRSVADAIADPVCRASTDEFWAEASRHLPVESEPAEYCELLVRRLANARIDYRLTQVASDGVMKMRARILPVIAAERAAGRSGAASIRVLATWIVMTTTRSRYPDSESEAIDAALAAADQVEALAAVLDPGLAADPEIMAALRAEIDALEQLYPHPTSEKESA